MKTITLGKSNLEVSAISLGCMRMNELGQNEAETLVKSAMDEGINFFDHADIYGKGVCEEMFGKILSKEPSLRNKMYIQSKCGIVPGVMYDFSKKHIMNSVDGILKRLQIEYLDVLLLHRPDALMEPEEVAETFAYLEECGKVRHFGVSNQKPSQMKLMQKYMKQPIVANQLQFSIPHSLMITSGINVNMLNDAAVDREESVLDYCRLEDITIQTWSPFQYGFFEGVFLDNEKFPELNAKIDEIAEKYGVTNTTIAIAWILRHPANMQAIAGTTNRKRLQDICNASEVVLTRQEWYEIYCAAGNVLP